MTIMMKRKSKKVIQEKAEGSNKELELSNQKVAELEKELAELRTWARKALDQVKQLESDKASLTKQVKELKKTQTQTKWWNNSFPPDGSKDVAMDTKLSMLMREKLQMEEDLHAMINDRDAKIALLEQNQQNEQVDFRSSTGSKGNSKSMLKKLSSARLDTEKATSKLREEVDESIQKISEMRSDADDSIDRLEKLMDNIRRMEGCDEVTAIALALGDNLSLIQEHVKVSLHLLELKVMNRLESKTQHNPNNRESFISNEDLIADIRIEVMGLIRKADSELNEKIKYMENEIEKLKEC